MNHGGFRKVLLVEDNRAEARLLQEILKGSRFDRFELVCAKRLAEGLQLLEKECFDAILLDLTLPDSQGLGSLPPLIAKAPTVPIVVLTNTNDDALAIAAVRQGAQDYLVKRQANAETLGRSLCYAIERMQALESLHATNAALESRVRERTAELAKAQERNQFQSEFVSMISHDFRNPMTAILLSAGLLQDDAYLSEEKKHLHFQMIRSAVNNMDRLLEEVLLVGKADSGKLCYRPEPLDIVALFRELVTETLSIEGDRHPISFSVSGKFPESAWDRNLLLHIGSNLLSNAIKYSPNGRKIYVALEGRSEMASEGCGETPDKTAAETVVLRVRDRGIGILPEDLENLFELFYRGNNVENIPGTGLGLALVKMCVDAHGGAIAVESELGQGTTFTITFPIRRA